MKKYKIIWYSGCFDFSPKAKEKILATIEEEAESIDKVLFITVLEKTEKEKYSSNIQYCLRTAWPSEVKNLSESKKCIIDYGSHTKFIYVEELGEMETEYRMSHCILKDGTELKLGDFIVVPNYEKTGFKNGLDIFRKVGMLTRIDYFDIREEYHFYIDDEEEYYVDRDVSQAFRFNDYYILEEIYKDE